MSVSLSCSHLRNVPIRSLLLSLWVLFDCGLLTAAPQSQQQLAEAERLNSQVIQLYSEGKYREAIPVAQRVLKIWETELGPLHSDVAAAYSNLGELHRQLNDFKAAKPLHERSLKIRERVFGQNHADTALSATYVAMVNEAIGDYPTAEKHYQQALKIREAVFGPDHPEVASALNNIGNLRKSQSQYAEAEKLFLRGLAIRRRTQGAEHPDNAPSLDNLASIYKDLGRFADAEPLYKQALQIRETHFGKEHPDTALTLNNLAALYDVQSRYAEAEPLFQRSLQIREKLLGRDHPLTAVTAGNLGGVRERQGDFQSAEQLYQRALTSLEKTAGPDHIDTGIVANNLAGLHKKQDRSAEAERLYQRALTIFEEKLGTDNRNSAQVLSNLGGLLEERGEFPTAERHYRRSLEIRRRLLGDDHPDTAQSINNLALLLAADSRVADAIPLLQQGLEIRQKSLGKQHPTAVGALENLAAYQEQQNDQQAIVHFDQARRGIREHVVRELPALTEAEQLRFLKVNYERGFQTAISVVLRHTDDLDVIEKSTSWLLNGKAISREAMAQKNLEHHRNSAGSTPTTWTELDELRAAIPAGAVFVDIAHLRPFDFQIRPGQPTWLPDRYAAWIIPAQGRGDVQFVDLGLAEPIDQLVADVRRTLLKAPGEKGDIAATSEQDAVTRLNDTLQAAATRLWKPLSERLGDSTELLLSPDGDLWLFPWSALPVGPPDDQGVVSSLVETYALRLLVSGRDLTRQKVVAGLKPPVIIANPEFDQQQSRKRQSVEAIFQEPLPADDNTSRSFSAKTLLPKVKPLPNTEVEALFIQPLLQTYAGQAVKVYKQRYALESVAKKLESPRVAVFATHGYFMPQQQTVDQPSFNRPSEGTRGTLLDTTGQPFENPLLRCGLLLSGCNQPGTAVGSDDGILTGVEVTGIDLRGTELVVLSACETGLGDIHNGEGVAGLCQAFQLAGAQSVVASLWHVSDRETSLLISDLFQHLADGDSTSQALQKAQLSRIKKRRERYGAAHPYYWAAFTLTGR
ncbi:MAG: CHAT domain-containing tetratricopeptide repeat protein [Planctomycetaceae bacterium]